MVGDRVVDPDNSVHNAGKSQQLTTKWKIPPNLELVKLQDAAKIDNRLGMFCFTNGNLIILQHRQPQMDCPEVTLSLLTVLL